MLKKLLEPFEGKNLPQRWGKSEISRMSDQLENVTFRLPTFFSKVSKMFSISHIAFIFWLRRVFIVILDPWKIWRAYGKTSEKYLGNTYPPQIAIWGGVCKYITSLTRVYPTCNIPFYMKKMYASNMAHPVIPGDTLRLNMYWPKMPKNSNFWVISQISGARQKFWQIWIPHKIRNWLISITSLFDMVFTI